MLSLLVSSWVLLLLAVRADSGLHDQLAYFGVVQVLQLGGLSVLVFIFTVWLDNGLLHAVYAVIKQFIAGRTFQLQRMALCFGMSDAVSSTVLALHQMIFLAANAG